MRTFPFVSCEPQCAAYSLDVHKQCQSKGQFGCLYRRCSTENFQCALNPQAASSNSCPNGDVLVQEVRLRPNFPVEFNIAWNLKGVDLDVVLLIDASESTKPRLDAVKNELSSFVTQLNGTAKVAVAAYGGEDSFDEKGLQVLSPAEEDVQPALDALENIPTFPDGVRTTLTALSSIQRYRSDLSLQGWRTIVVLIGDTPGREPECSLEFDRDEVARSLFGFTSGISVIPASLGGPGLDGDLAPVQPCANGLGPTEPQEVAAGQASKIAERTEGEVVSSITATNLWEAVDRVRRKPNRSHQSRPGSVFSIADTQNVLPSYMLQTCTSKMNVITTNIPDFVSAPSQITGKVRLELKPGICQRGPFNCSLTIGDRVTGNEGVSHYFHIRYYKNIQVRGC
ncbi:von Willebrand factor A-like protein [Gracilaria domingensis]|nr:von Willebrand factor A-like protein [Gracilaria domingensis]